MARKENIIKTPPPAYSPRYVRKQARAQAAFERELDRERNKAGGITRYEDGPRIPRAEDRIRESQAMNAAGRADTALRAGYNPNQSARTTGTAAATGQQLQDRLAFAEELKGGTGEVTADVLKRAGALGLNQSDVGSYLRRVGKTPVAVNSATVAPAVAPAAAPAAAVASTNQMPNAAPVAASTASGVPNSVSPAKKNVPALAGLTAASNGTPAIGSQLAAIPNVSPKLADAVKRIAATTPAVAAPAVAASAVAAPAVAAPAVATPKSTIDGIDAKAHRQMGYADELRLSRMGKGPEPFWRKEVLGEQDDTTRASTERSIKHRDRIESVNDAVRAGRDYLDKQKKDRAEFEAKYGR
jgi:hypothetical protein